MKIWDWLIQEWHNSKIRMDLKIYGIAADLIRKRLESPDITDFERRRLEKELEGIVQKIEDIRKR